MLAVGDRDRDPLRRRIKQLLVDPLIQLDSDEHERTPSWTPTDEADRSVLLAQRLTVNLRLTPRSPPLRMPRRDSWIRAARRWSSSARSSETQYGDVRNSGRSRATYAKQSNGK